MGQVARTKERRRFDYTAQRNNVRQSATLYMNAFDSPTEHSILPNFLRNIPIRLTRKMWLQRE